MIYRDRTGGSPAFMGMGYNLLAGSSTTFTPAMMIVVVVMCVDNGDGDGDDDGEWDGDGGDVC